MRERRAGGRRENERIRGTREKWRTKWGESVNGGKREK